MQWYITNICEETGKVKKKDNIYTTVPSQVNILNLRQAILFFSKKVQDLIITIWNSSEKKLNHMTHYELLDIEVDRIMLLDVMNCKNELKIHNKF